MTQVAFFSWMEEEALGQGWSGWLSFPQGLQESSTLGSTTENLICNCPLSPALGTCWVTADALAAGVPRLYTRLRGGS